MSKPWDNEPTPFKDQLIDEHGYFFISQNTVENLERRLRHAERLLDKVCNWLRVDSELEQYIVVHLDAARKQDEK